MITTSTLVLGGLLLYVLRRVYRVATTVKSLRGVPTYICLVQPYSPASALLPSGSWNPGVYYPWNAKDTLYKDRHTEIVLYVPLLYGDFDLLCSSPDAVKEILNNPSLWTKPARSLVLDMMGPNLVASKDEQWRRQRKITAPAFDTQSYENVWEVTTQLYHEMTNSRDWGSGNQLFQPSFNKFTTRLALLVISACGFNMHLGWDESSRRDDLKLANAVDETIMLVSTSLLERIILPSWVWQLPIKGYIMLLYCAKLRSLLEILKDIFTPRLQLRSEHQGRASKS